MRTITKTMTLTATAWLALTSTACGKKNEQFNKKSADAVISKEQPAPADAAPTTSTVPAPDAPAAAEALPKRTFAALAITGLDAKTAGLLVAPGAADQVLFTAPGGVAFSYTESTQKLAPLKLGGFKIKDAIVYPVVDGEAWVLTKDSVARTTPRGTSKLYQQPAVKAALADVIGANDPAKLTVLGVLPSTLLLGIERSVIVLQFDGTALSGIEAGLPESIADQPIAAGVTNDGKSFWFLLEGRLLLLKDSAWSEHALDFELPEGSKLTGLGIRLAVPEGSAAPVIEGAVYALSQDQVLVSAAVEAPAEPVAPEEPAAAPTWSLEVRSIADRYCVQCHSNFSEEAVWRGRKDEIIRRVDAATKGESFAMPPVNTVPAMGIKDADRKILIDWLSSL